jgi:hypothetical protein
MEQQQHKNVSLLATRRNTTKIEGASLKEQLAS